jgi:hypothetical protein
VSGGTGPAAPQAAGAADLASGTVCRRCFQRVAVEGDPEWGRAVHAATGSELGPDGHLVAPVDAAVVFCRVPGSVRAGAR